MNKKSMIVALFLAVIMSLSLVLVACDKDGDEPVANVKDAYVIQYTDDTGTYVIDVKPGEPYSMSAIPTREGYDFLGLFDAEVGGTQYVNSQGASLAPFTDNKNLVLFPQFKAKEYRLVLNYQGAPVTGEREIVVSFGSRIQALPMDLTLENKTFMGWWTEPDRKGLQVADEYGVLPEASLISSRNFDLTDPDGFIRLYAGFRGEMHSVTFYFEDGTVPEEMEIEHDTPIGNVVTETRVDGKAVLTWSREPNDEDRNAVFNGRVEGDMVLYALDYAPVIDFDANGGDEVTSIIARTGSTIVLPEAERENWQFAGWYTAGGSKYTATTMPSDSVKLIAKWNPMLIFDERGGTLVDDIAAEQGTRVALPTTEKDGYMFAGWYTEQGTEYTATFMPEHSTKLVAKYYAIEKTTRVIIQAGDEASTDRTYEVDADFAISLDMSALSGVIGQKVKVTGSMLLKYQGTSAGTQRRMAVDFYSSAVLSETNLLSRHIFNVSSEDYVKYTFETEWILPTNCLVCFYLPDGYFNYLDAYWSDFWIEVEYPDMSQLY